MTFPWQNHYDENFIPSLSHDEVVHGKHSPALQDAWGRVAAGREPAPTWVSMYAHPGKKLNFMGKNRDRPEQRVEP